MSAFTDWSAAVHAKGGTVVRRGSGQGHFAARYKDSKAPGGWRYEDAPLTVRLADDLDMVSDAEAKAAGAVADTATSAIEATGLDHGLIGLVSKATGVNRVVLLGVAALVGLALLNNAGIDVVGSVRRSLSTSK